jgi:hypothetical protein
MRFDFVDVEIVVAVVVVVETVVVVVGRSMYTISVTYFVSIFGTSLDLPLKKYD